MRSSPPVKVKRKKESLMRPETEELVKKSCKPCEGGISPLTSDQIQGCMKLLFGWKVTDSGKKIQKEYLFKNFKEVIDFFDRTAKICEKENHHPDFHISYKKVVVEFWTHAINGLSDNDFILAAKFDLEASKKSVKN
jgi:4a-hydroxytetrahydrobiopterin dehydratase